MTEVTPAMIEAGEHAWMHRNLRDTAGNALAKARGEQVPVEEA